MARYTMRQRLVSIGEDFDIADEHGNPVFRVDGKAMRLRDTFVLEDLQGREVATIREKKLALRESMNILSAGTTIATVRKARFTPFRNKFTIDVEGGQDIVAQRDILHHEYELRRGNDAVARISKRRFALSDTYGIETALGEDDGTHPRGRRRDRRDGPRRGRRRPLRGGRRTAAPGIASVSEPLTSRSSHLLGSTNWPPKKPF
jgi:uncharacterized protein YxjI